MSKVEQFLLPECEPSVKIYFILMIVHIVLKIIFDLPITSTCRIPPILYSHKKWKEKCGLQLSFHNHILV